MQNPLKNMFFIFSLLIGVGVFFYDIIFELLFDVLMFGYELIESGLDSLVELTFDTERRQTEVIVFYLMMTFVVMFGGWIAWLLPKIYRKFRAHFSFHSGYQKNQIGLYYQQLSKTGKVKWMGFILLSVSGIVLFFLCC